eukprot:gene61193-83704_t
MRKAGDGNFAPIMGGDNAAGSAFLRSLGPVKGSRAGAAGTEPGETPMVKATFTNQLNFDTIDTFYADDSLRLRTEQDGRAIYVDKESGNRIVLDGSNFSYDGDQVVGGTVDSVTFKGSEGGDFAAITDAGYDAG